MLPRKKIALTNDAFPSIFPNLPKYLTLNSSSVERNNPQERKRKYYEMENEKYENWLREDNFNSLEEVFLNQRKFRHEDWVIEKKDSLYFLKVIFQDIPVLKHVLILDSNFKVKVISDNIKVNTKCFEYILGSELCCNSYGKLGNLLNAISNLPEKLDISDRLESITNVLTLCIEECDNEKLSVGINFIKQQLTLLNSKKYIYSTEFLMFACSFFFSFPAAYRYLRDTNLVILPHPNYLKKFNLKNLNCDINESLQKYLSEKCQNLEPHERFVSLLLDEIYVKPKFNYTENDVVGMAKNVSELEAATTLQAFMIKSLLSHNKDIAAMIPVKKLNSEFLLQTTLKVLNLLLTTGYVVISIISDNNKVNVKLFQELSGGKVILSPIINPVDPSKKIFLLFDTVHLFKNIKNNWLNEKTKTFLFPSFDDNSVLKEARFQVICDLYESEKNALVKRAPGLSRKVCYPNNLERQNVKLTVQVFDEKTIAAVEDQGTKEFLSIIHRWWTIVNVKHPKKGKHLREIYADPVRSMNQININFLKLFRDWLQSWEDITILDMPKRMGKFSAQTHAALLHTTDTLYKLCHYLLNDLNFTYVLLGSFQTDDLEERFGKFRKMSGCNYHISVKQIIESERKLKVTSLLRLKSKDINVRDIIVQINNTELETQIADNSVFFENTDEIIAKSLSLSLDQNTTEVIVFIAGYVGYKVSSKFKCLKCKDMLLTSSEMMCEVPDLDYIKNLNRGGLKYPSQFSVNIAIRIFQIFQILLSDKYEILFLNCSNKKNLVKSILREAVETESFLQDLYFANYQCECKTSIFDIYDRIIHIWINILLNNYIKSKTNAIDAQSSSSKGKRKLNVLQCAK